MGVYRKLGSGSQKSSLTPWNPTFLVQLTQSVLEKLDQIFLVQDHLVTKIIGNPEIRAQKPAGSPEMIFSYPNSFNLF
jgi:hypothetical protein